MKSTYGGVGAFISTLHSSTGRPFVGQCVVREADDVDEIE